MSWHIHGQVDGPAGVKDLEPDEPIDQRERAQVKRAREIAVSLLKGPHAGKAGPYLVTLAGHVSAGEPNEPEAHLTVSVAHDNSAPTGD